MKDPLLQAYGYLFFGPLIGGVIAFLLGLVFNTGVEQWLKYELTLYTAAGAFSGFLLAFSLAVLLLVRSYPVNRETTPPNTMKQSGGGNSDEELHSRQYTEQQIKLLRGVRSQRTSIHPALQLIMAVGIIAYAIYVIILVVFLY